MDSYRKIDYRIRPGKYAERLMMVEAFRRLRFASIESYQYVGLGSVYFSDFSLIHRSLGITKLVSIERAEHDKKRFEANIPFRCVELRWGDTATEIPKIDWSLRSIVWLDYDGRLSKSVLADVRHVAAHAVSGTVLAISVQSKFDRVVGENGDDASVDTLKEALGEDRVPLGTKTSDLRGDGTGALFRDVLIEEISNTLRDRNAGRHTGQAVRFKQFMNFRYEDGVRMMTVAVVFYDAGQEGLVAGCEFADLTFYREDEHIFDIRIPKLTPREAMILDRQLPCSFQDYQFAPIPERDARQYSEIYRYFPNIAFVDG